MNKLTEKLDKVEYKEKRHLELINIIKNHKLTQKELAEICGVSDPIISLIKNPKYSITINLIEKYINLLTK